MTIEFFDLGKNTNARQIVKAPAINIGKTGRLTYNRALTDNVIKNNEFVLIGQDRKKPNFIAFKFVPNDQGGQAFKISMIKQTNTYYTSALQFFRAKAIDPEGYAGTHEVKIKGDLVLLELNPFQLDVFEGDYPDEE